MSFLSQMPHLPLAPRDGSPFPFARTLTPERREALLECSTRYPIFRLLGMQIEDIDTDFCRIALLHRLELTNPMGGLHGGIITVLDTAVGFAMVTTMKEGFVVGTVGLDVKFFKPLLEGRAVAEARVQRKGRNILFADTRLTSDADETLAAGTCIYMPIARQ